MEAPERQEGSSGSTNDADNGAAVAEERTGSGVEPEAMVTTAPPTSARYSSGVLGLVAATNTSGYIPKQDGSVVSGMTDPASLEGVVGAQVLPDEAKTSLIIDHRPVPKQVILPDEAHEANTVILPTIVSDEVDTEDDSRPPSPRNCCLSDPGDDHEPLVVTSTPPVELGVAQTTVSMSALPDPPSSLAVEATTPTTTAASARHASVEDEAAAVAVAGTGVSSAVVVGGATVGATASSDGVMTSDDGLDDYIRSPEVQNAIVERSPGGRYVRFMEKLGSGASKEVYRAYDTQEGIEVAWNVVKLSGVPKAERNRIVNEVRLLERLHHHNIISFHGSWVNRERQEVNFVTEILSSGTLKSFIHKVQVIRWKIAKRWAIQILKGLEYLHLQDPPVIHRDLKCENIFINGTSGDLRIGDLGLSTVHRNGRVLSVLGTPEFMAPDMYEESSYDEKVDIYSFGMCMLEIFTQEIPYAECNNPAQIYKKVSSGEPPEVLARLQSKHAREFVMLCLGYKDEQGVYVRPTASELLKHPFLIKRQNDDDEVVVDPPMREMVIKEAPNESSPMSTPPVKRSSTKMLNTSSSGPSQTQPQAPPPPSQADGVSSTDTTVPARARARPSTQSTNSLDEEDGDRFDEMPQSESNFRKVKVLMGRGQEWKEQDGDERDENVAITTHEANVPPTAPPTMTPSTSPSPPLKNPLQGSAPAAVAQDSMAVPGVADLPVAAPPASSQDQATGGTSQLAQPAQSSSPTPLTYLVAAAVLENENGNVRPYADDMLKLVVTLPVDGQTQNVQFDFHLIEDDPVQVAKEMVQELGIPQGAVLEISGTISGLARAARMKQDKYVMRLQNGQNLGYPTQQQGIVDHTGTHRGPQGEVSTVSTSSPVAEYGSVLPATHYAMPNLQLPAGQQPQQQQQQQQPAMYGQTQGVYGQHSVHQHDVHGPQQAQFPPNPNKYQHQGQQQQQYVPQQGMQHLSQQQQQQHQASMHGQQQHGHQYPLQGHQAPPQVHQYGDQELQQTATQHHQSASALNQGSQQQAPVNQYPGGSAHQSTGPQSVPPGQDDQVPHANGPGASSQTPQSQAPTDSSHHALESVLPANHTAKSTAALLATREPGSSMPGTVQSPPMNSRQPPRHQVSNPEAIQRASQVSQRSISTGSGIANFSVAETLSTASNDGNGSDIDSDDEDQLQELRKLDEEFQKNMMRAKRVFENRMDSLQRSQVEREAQHQKTLEKHQKDRAEFEKRLTQEEEQQNRRLDQLQMEWDKRRETLAKHKRKQHGLEETDGNTSTDITQKVNGATQGEALLVACVNGGPPEGHGKPEEPSSRPHPPSHGHSLSMTQPPMPQQLLHPSQQHMEGNGHHYASAQQQNGYHGQQQTPLSAAPPPQPSQQLQPPQQPDR